MVSEDFGLDIASGLIHHQDGTFGVYVLLSITGWDDVEPMRNVLTDQSGAPVSFATEREAKIAAFDWLEDTRRDTMSNPPPRLTWSSGEIEPVDIRDANG